MRTIAVMSQKGGAGKSTLAIHIAVGLLGFNEVRLVDLDPQGSITAWRERRDVAGPALPLVVASHPARLPMIVAHAAKEGVGVLVIDTSPAADRAAQSAVAAADFVLVPCRPAQFDLDAVGQTVRMAQLAGKPFAVMLNACPSSRPGGIVDEAAQAIADAGLPLLKAQVGARIAFQRVLPGGMTVMEEFPRGQAARDIAQLCEELGVIMTARPKKRGAA
jgi:chromosome partitioning protein